MYLPPMLFCLDILSETKRKRRFREKRRLTTTTLFVRLHELKVHFTHYNTISCIILQGTNGLPSHKESHKDQRFYIGYIPNRRQEARSLLAKQDLSQHRRGG